MTDITLTPVTTGYNIGILNDNLEVIEDVVNNDLLHTTGGNNTMNQQLDMDGNAIINTYVDVGNPDSLVNVQMVTDLMEGYAIGTEAELIGYAPEGTGAVVRTVKDVLDSSAVRVADFLTPAALATIEARTNTTNNSAALQAAIDAAGPLGTIVLPKGRIEFSTPLDIPASSFFRIVGFGKYRSELLWRGGADVAIVSQADNLELIDLHYSGYKPGTDTQVFQTGSTGYSSTGVVEAYNCWLDGFSTLHEWGGGYYHKYVNCRLRYFKKGIANASANNVNFVGCRVTDIEQLIEYSGGDGPINVVNCSIEKFTGSGVIRAISGARALVNLHNNYIENYPSDAVANGLTGTNYDAGVLINSPLSFSVRDNVIYTKGLSRVVTLSGTAEVGISEGNVFNVNGTGAEGATGVLYRLQGLNAGKFKDVIRNGPYTGAYSDAVTLPWTTTYPEQVQIWDAVDLVDVSPVSDWITLTINTTDGWSADTNVPEYRLHGGKVQLRGNVDGSGATANPAFTIPTAAKPSVQKYFPITNTAGTLFVGGINPSSGNFNITGAGAYTNNISLDGVTYDVS